MFSPLLNLTYRHLFLAQVIALVGTGFLTVALGLLAYDLAGAEAGAVLGTALAIKMVAYVGVAPVAGAFADRLPRRAFLVTMDLLRAAVALCLPFVTEIWQVYALIFVLQSASAAFTPTFQATIPDVLPEEAEYTKALSLARLAYDLESLASPTLAAALLTVVAYHDLFAATVVGFAGSALLVRTAALPAPRPVHGRGGVYARMTLGLRAYLKTPRLRGLLALNGAVAAAGAMVIVNTVVLVRGLLDGTDADVAVLLAAYGAGSMLLALTLPRLLERVADRPVMLAGAGLLAAGLLALAALLAGRSAGSWAALLALWFTLGLANAAVLTPTGRLLRRSAHAEQRPALFAAQFGLSHAAWLLAYPLAGWLGAAAGLGVTALVLGGLAAACTALAMVLWPAGDPVEVEHTHGPHTHEHPHVHDEHHKHHHDGWDGREPHVHPHRHGPLRHSHAFVIDDHHGEWPQPT
ncbi:MFS transporter [Azospirillum sp. RWY-5-1]|uniref:MFS transporter n=1 Tax=Azospirillum oleiclasticum TaxID=2735135 RepID=A0ABX2TBX4_9PROT|nr:MFS transporter [Azospirillum oleiclasticum]NYZ21851.1 MFS transporter [Azospirillum oleiclasticum]